MAKEGDSILSQDVLRKKTNKIWYNYKHKRENYAMNSQLFSQYASAMLVAAVVFALPTTGVSATNITGHVTLAADADWRGLGPVALAEGATLNLNEHTLKVDELAQTLDPGEDVTSSSGTVTSSTLASGSAAFLFDNDMRYTQDWQNPSDLSKNHRILVTGNNFPATFTYDFGEGNGKILRAYKIYFQGSNFGRAPKNWTFEGSNDNGNWTTLDTRTGETGWRNPETRAYSFNNRNLYRYYRLNVSAGVDGNSGISPCLKTPFPEVNAKWYLR